MSNERRTILALMAAGRISAADAERLLRACNDRFEACWIAALCVMVCLAQLHLVQLYLQVPAGGLGHWLNSLLRESLHAWDAAAALLTNGIGGTI